MSFRVPSAAAAPSLALEDRGLGPRAALLAPILLLAAGCGLASGDDAVPERTEMLWDTWGVPHIYATDALELFRAFGWAQMRAHGDLVLRLYGEARGRAAEYWGAEHLEDDRYLHTMGVPERAAAWYDAQSPEMKRNLDAFVAGMNEYAAAHPEELADEVEVVLPVVPSDLLAHVQRVIHLTFVGGEAPWMAGEWANGGPGSRASARGWPGPDGPARERLGSNAWAIAPSRSASGHAMLVANPHLPWNGFFTWFEAQLVAPGVDAYGAALVGMPILGIAFNDRLGWTHTVNTFDGMDLYELELAGDGYLWDGEPREFETERKTLRVREEDGTLREEALIVRRSVHGPVLASRDGKALAVRITGLDDPDMLGQYWDMARASSLEEFEAALSRLQNPFFNVVYADRDGRIMYLFGGRQPRRPAGGWGEWRGIVPGTSSETLWTGTLAYEELPRVVDPPQGWVQNANDPPWTSTFPPALDPADFPPYLAPRSMGLRPQRSVRMLVEDDRIAFEEAVAYKLSTRAEMADRLLDDLLPAARARGGERAHEAADVLEAWDRATEVESRGAVLFAAWVEAVGDGVFAVPWSEERPRATPDGLADPEAAVAALEEAARRVREAYGALDVPWGEVYRLRAPGVDLPANGGPGRLGIFRVTGYAEDEAGGYRAVAGDSWQAVIEFSEPVRARVLLSYGNSSQPGSPHRGDQLELYSRKELRPAWRTREEVERHLEERVALAPPAGHAPAPDAAGPGGAGETGAAAGGSR